MLTRNYHLLETELKHSSGEDFPTTLGRFELRKTIVRFVLAWDNLSGTHCQISSKPKYLLFYVWDMVKFHVDAETANEELQSF